MEVNYKELIISILNHIEDNEYLKIVYSMLLHHLKSRH